MIEKEAYPNPNPVRSLNMLLNLYLVNNCNVPSMIIKRINPNETYIFPYVNMVIIGPSKTNPINIPVHLAHKGNCIPFIWKLLSGN